MKDYDYENENLNDNYIDDYDNGDFDDDIISDLVKPQSTKRRKTPEEYYVKGADLINEIKKYRESKEKDALERNVPIEER